MARGTVNVNMHTTYGPAPGQVGNAEVRKVEQTLPKPSPDLQIPGAASIQPYRCGAPPPASSHGHEQMDGGVGLSWVTQGAQGAGLVHCDLLLP